MNFYLACKIIHIVGFTSWMAGMFYLPRLYVYHTECALQNSEQDKMLQTMEYKLLRYIMTPAMLVTFIFGLFLITQIVAGVWPTWLILKVILVLGMAALHGFLGKERIRLAEGLRRPGKFYRLLNEVPTLLFILIVILAVAKPF